MSKSRRTFSVSRAFYERLSAYCAERGVSMSALCERVVNEAMGVPYVERPRLAVLLVGRPAKPTPQPAQRPAAPTCPICFRIGHTSEFHNRPATIEVSQGLFELLDDLRIRARELEGRDVTHAELLEQGIERALEALG